jgi:hypothetical protein
MATTIEIVVIVTVIEIVKGIAVAVVVVQQMIAISVVWAVAVMTGIAISIAVSIAMAMTIPIWRITGTKVVARRYTVVQSETAARIPVRVIPAIGVSVTVGIIVGDAVAIA